MKNAHTHTFLVWKKVVKYWVKLKKDCRKIARFLGRKRGYQFLVRKLARGRRKEFLIRRKKTLNLTKTVLNFSFLFILIF